MLCYAVTQSRRQSSLINGIPHRFFLLHSSLSSLPILYFHLSHGLSILVCVLLFIYPLMEL